MLSVLAMEFVTPERDPAIASRDGLVSPALRTLALETAMVMVNVQTDCVIAMRDTLAQTANLRNALINAPCTVFARWVYVNALTDMDLPTALNSRLTARVTAISEVNVRTERAFAMMGGLEMIALFVRASMIVVDTARVERMVHASVILVGRAVSIVLSTSTYVLTTVPITVNVPMVLVSAMPPSWGQTAQLRVALQIAMEMGSVTQVFAFAMPDMKGKNAPLLQCLKSWRLATKAIKSKRTVDWKLT